MYNECIHLSKYAGQDVTYIGYDDFSYIWQQLKTESQMEDYGFFWSVIHPLSNFWCVEWQVRYMVSNKPQVLVLFFFVSRQLFYLKCEFERWMLLSLALEIDTPMLKIKSCTSRFFFVWIFRVQTGDRDSFDRLQTLSPYQCLKRYLS